MDGIMGQTTAVNTSIQSDSGFIGWYLGPSTTQALMDPATWTTSGRYARGCSANDTCAYATNCQDNRITYDNGKICACPTCRTMTIFQTAPYETPSASNVFCANYWVAFTIFRKLPATTTSSEPSTITTAASTSSTTLPSATASSTALPEPDASPTGSSNSNQAWIAGPVVGSIAAVATIAAFYRPKSPTTRCTDTRDGCIE
ncbi:hypothetical protein P170DRAFT_111958 [Aspergillus steynii IBT 23096]|uniref:Uncharacterized protein n=1 Tax=Aspergillus steynii IBT 23096 TaxID=1392250 RepID=A0A2I2GIQ7_9EURO|nr:uncharacterized protein P170DRAFT_111958 [Aspergillus steynii IBT 23096]PLB52766.1 hypothetical protein P170DRAFT_111958 [Aspergillus steynii IBT 23096]